MLHLRYAFLFCVVDVVEHHGLKITFDRDAEEYLFHFLTNNPHFLVHWLARDDIFASRDSGSHLIHHVLR